MRAGCSSAEGEDLIEAAEAAGWTPEILLRSGEDVEPELLDRVSSLGSGARVIGVYQQRWSEPSGDVCVYLHGVGDPGNVGTIDPRRRTRSATGRSILGPDCADPYGPKAVRASMGSVFARPPARAAFAELRGIELALDGGARGRSATRVRACDRERRHGRPAVVLCVGAERDGLSGRAAPGRRRAWRASRRAPTAPTRSTSRWPRRSASTSSE